MPCGSCGGGKPSARNARLRTGFVVPEVTIATKTTVTSTDPSEWGPLVWRLLHLLGTKVGKSNNSGVSMEQCNLFYALVQRVATILPCSQCQGHANSYISSNPVPTPSYMTISHYSNIIQTWLFTFHNAVRQRLNQPITVTSMQEYNSLYAVPFDKELIKNIEPYIIYGIDQSLVTEADWTRWLTMYNVLLSKL